MPSDNALADVMAKLEEVERERDVWKEAQEASEAAYRHVCSVFAPKGVIVGAGYMALHLQHLLTKLKAEPRRVAGEREGRISERKRIMDLFGEIGRELMNNGKDLAAWGESESLEGRARVIAGMCVSDVAQILFTEIRSDEYFEKTDAILRDMQAELGPDRWEEIKKESEDFLKMEEGMNNRIEVGSIVSQKTIEETPLYDVVEQLVQMSEKAGDTMPTLSILSKSGDYAGDFEDTRKFFDEHGIAPELRSEGDSVCSIGWSEKKQKWYGWSHRSWQGLGIGDAAFGSALKITTLEGAKASAIAFAEDVS